MLDCGFDPREHKYKEMNRPNALNDVFIKVSAKCISVNCSIQNTKKHDVLRGHLCQKG